MANYTGDSTHYNTDKNIEFLVNNLEFSSSIIFKWLNDNYMKVNTGKGHLLVYGNVRVMATIDNNYIESGKGQMFLGITIGCNLTFENHIFNQYLETEMVKI